MDKIYITGHRNPDLDSLCAAASYANLKNTIDKNNEYIPVHCSPVSDSVKKQMENFDLKVPMYLKDVYPKVGDVMFTETAHLDSSAPIFDLMHTYSVDGPSSMPIYENGEFKGLLSDEEIMEWLLSDNMKNIPEYHMSCKNISRVIRGEMIHKGKQDDIEGSILVGAAPLETFDEFTDEARDKIVIMGFRKEHIEMAVSKNVPAIIIAALREAPDFDFSGYEGSVFITSKDTAETARRLRMAESISDMMFQKTETVSADERFDEVRNIFIKTRTRGLAVMDGDKYVGYVTRRCFLDKPSYKVIMVDHNEPAQSIEGIETATVMEIIDHHRLDAISTMAPIFIDAEPLGSTCTIVYQLYNRYGVEPDEYTARMMLTGIISDTLILRSPTTTIQDINTVKELVKIAKVDCLDDFGRHLFSVTKNLAEENPKSMIKSDFKIYKSSGVKFGIGQCEVVTLSDVPEYADDYIDALNGIRERKGLDWAMLMVTDVLTEKSVLLTSDYRENKNLPYKALKPQIYDMPGVMSRKKQLLPTIISVTAK